MEFKNIFKNSIEAVQKSAKSVQAFVSTAKLGATVVPTVSIMSCTCIIAIAVKDVDETVHFFENEEFKSVQVSVRRGHSYPLRKFDDRYYLRADEHHTLRFSETAFRKYFVEHILEDSTDEE